MNKILTIPIITRAWVLKCQMYRDVSCIIMFHSIKTKLHEFFNCAISILFLLCYQKELFKMTVVRLSLLISVHMSLKLQEDFNKFREKFTPPLRLLRWNKNLSLNFLSNVHYTTIGCHAEDYEMKIYRKEQLAISSRNYILV